MKLNIKPIGIIHTPFIELKGMPIQFSWASGIKGTIDLNEDLADGLLDLSGFSHIYLIYYFHRSEDYQLHLTPFTDDQVHEVFATRAPKRPNQIGLSVVKLLKVRGNILEIENADIVDGTPLPDIKPYVPAFDFHKTQKCGWLTQNGNNATNARADNRFE